MLEAKAKDQGHKSKCSSKKSSSQKSLRRSQKQNKTGLQKKFSGVLQYKTPSKIFFQASYKISTIQKKVLSSSRGQSNFRGLEASRPRPRTSKCVLKDVLEAKDVLEDSTSVPHTVESSLCPFVLLNAKLGIEPRSGVSVTDA